ncbi:DUF6896 domain-containing protein [Achromobacter xylosoxidans]|uniref:DUF6896 domain-containing protein n=1 Tax=Alcaligenes xylosoxydans xylosoxydans TaxID=85698 RepID=UPI0006C0ACC5|nr:hypothetical protein [Achromobacter xylosoxidans]KOQ22612.1 hypothetical protein ABW34_19280 [Achromobacter xylosoxidans]KOQ26269.1 hypothetical protein ABW35_11430 [Achromobacter xylosoxidans]KOQ34154.1 hypothetical protein ABW36_07225 [Achromobacter xylosoxidans]KOQ43198.1 hypothetical protein ABW37_12740 [Achromobacter xylosoxidans]KOQ51110.1 hypothetical protein ABW39_03675 [Achromobacter xylosoxidans]
MDVRLLQVIREYQISVRRSVELMCASGIAMPSSGHDWAQMDIPRRGVLDRNVPYYKHGYGCTVSLPSGTVDFDFGRHGEINGFDPWRLASFAKFNLAAYGFETSESLEEAFQEAVQRGEIVWSEPTIYYLKNCERIFAVEISHNKPDDKLPHRDHDVILALYTHCFLAADLMRINYEKIIAQTKKHAQLSQNKEVQARIYATSWLAYLAATCEGFQKKNVRQTLIKSRPKEFLELIPECDNIGSLIKLHDDALRKFRNSVFHLRDTPRPIINFFADDQTRLTWAETLHRAFNSFCSNYRILCEVHYMMNNRMDESIMKKRK